MSPLVGRLARAFAASLLLLVLAGAGVAAAADIGHEDFPLPALPSRDPSPRASSGTTTARGGRACGAQSPAGFFIYRLDRAPTRGSGRIPRSTPEPRPALTRSGMDRSCMSRRNSGARTAGIRDQARTTRPGSTATATTPAPTPTRSMVASLPSIRPKIQSESLVIAKDSTGMLWATWTLKAGSANLVYTRTRSSATTRTGPRPPATLPFSAASTELDDISSIIAFTVSGEHRIGVFWSNQDDKKDYFAWQPDSGTDDDWTLETAINTIDRRTHPRRRPHEPQDRSEWQGLRGREDEQQREPAR